LDWARAEINHPVRVGSGTGHKAVFHQVQIAVSLIAAVILYILAGMFALKWAKSRFGQTVSFMIALGLFAFAATIAVTKTPLIV
jgi:uncharacterized membrane protein SirB2